MPKKNTISKICKRCGKIDYFNYERKSDYCRECYKKLHKKEKFNCRYCGKEKEKWPSQIKNGGGKYCSKRCAFNAKIGTINTEEANQKNRESQLKRFSEHPMTEETKKKIGKSNTGKKKPWLIEMNKSKKMRELVSKALTGRIRTKEHCKHLSESKKGKYLGENSILFGKRGKDTPGYKNPKDRIMPLMLAIRSSCRNKQYIQDGFSRDGYSCKKCGDNKGGNLNFHHKKSFNTIYTENHIQSLEGAYNCPEFWDLNNGITLCRKCHEEFHKKYGWKNTIIEQTEEFLKK
jgi:hypothetical protein